jgi:hypothetical protein
MMISIVFITLTRSNEYIIKPAYGVYIYIYIYSPTKVEHHLRAIPGKSVSWGQKAHEI